VNDSTICVAMSLNTDAQPFVRRNAVATIGTDGLVGNTIINLTAQPAPARGGRRPAAHHHPGQYRGHARHP
jgi:ABC-type transporter Mla subunit MlaD